MNTEKLSAVCRFYDATAERRDELAQMVEDCEARQDGLNSWEAGFIANCRTRLERGNTFTQDIADKLEQIWEKVAQ